jgi:hypothetical protein
MKVCVRCGIEKDESEFGVDNKKKDGLNIYCRECVKEKNRESRARNRETINARHREYDKAHPE